MYAASFQYNKNSKNYIHILINKEFNCYASHTIQSDTIKVLGPCNLSGNFYTSTYHNLPKHVFNGTVKLLLKHHFTDHWDGILEEKI